MDILSLHKSQDCENYTEKERPIIERRSFTKGDKWNLEINHNKLIVITEGDISISYKKISDDVLTQGNIAFLPIGHKINFCARKNASITIFRLLYKIDFCKHFSHDELSYKEILSDILSESIHNKRSDRQYGCELISETSLKANDYLCDYLHNLHRHLDSQIICSGFFELKLKELFFLLQAYYPKPRLLIFFKPFICCDQEFTSIVMGNIDKVKTVKELAALTNYSISGFEKRFKRVFHASAGNWMKKQRSINIYHEISTGEEPFKQICIKNGFSSLSHFNNYCKQNFGLTPGEIRKEGKNQE